MRIHFPPKDGREYQPGEIICVEPMKKPDQDYFEVPEITDEPKEKE